MKAIRIAFLSSLAAILATSSLLAAQTFTIGKGSDARQLATVESVADFETFTGRTAKVTGTVSVDVAKKTGSASITVDAATIDTGIDMRDEHMRSAQWLDTDKFPTIKFVTTSVKNVKGDNYKVTGKLTLHGVTRTITTDATVRYLKEGANTKKAGFEGDVVHIKTAFNIKLSDYGIKVPEKAQGKVANSVKISLTAFATQ